MYLVDADELISTTCNVTAADHEDLTSGVSSETRLSLRLVLRKFSSRTY